MFTSISYDCERDLVQFEEKSGNKLVEVRYKENWEFLLLMTYVNHQ